jgi:hypothetical protein
VTLKIGKKKTKDKKSPLKTKKQRQRRKDEKLPLNKNIFYM